MHDTTLANLLSHPAVVSARRRRTDYLVVLNVGTDRFMHVIDLLTTRNMMEAEIHVLIDDAVRKTSAIEDDTNPDAKTPVEILLEIAQDKALDPGLRFEAARTLLTYTLQKRASKGKR